MGLQFQRPKEVVWFPGTKKFPDIFPKPSNCCFTFNRQKPAKPKKPKGQASPPAPAVPDPDGDEYSTVDECASIRSLAGLDQTCSVTPESVAAGPAASGPQDEPLNMVECELYSEATEALGGVATSTMPDISPYACFYGAPKHQVFKAGWLDKLSPQGYVLAADAAEAADACQQACADNVV